MAKKPKAKTFTSLTECVKHLDATQAEIIENDKDWREKVRQLTGHDPRQAMTPLDVVKIVQHVFDRRYMRHGADD